LKRYQLSGNKASEPVYKLDEVRKKKEMKSKIRGKINNMCPKVPL
jgi:hypothetical protein